MKLGFSRQIFEKYSNVKFHDYLSSGSRVVPYGQMDRKTDMAKLIVAFRDFETRPKQIFMKWTCSFRLRYWMNTDLGKIP